MSDFGKTSREGLVVVQGHAGNVSSRIQVDGSGHPKALTEVRFELGGVPVLARVAHDFLDVSENDKLIVAGYFKDSDLWANYWWNCTNENGHVPKARFFLASIVVSVALFVALTGLILWQPRHLYSSVSMFGVFCLLFSLTMVQMGHRERKAARLIDAARRELR
jgi:hypothetical protein